MNNTEQLFQLGQSIWYDNIQRGLLANGELAGMIKRHEIFGVTSNPSIFQNAIAKTSDYDSALKPMAWSGWNAEQIFWELAIEDIRAAADLFKPVYIETSGQDGYVSLEVNPLIAHDAEITYTEALRLWQRVDRENLMIKIPATKEGLPAVRKAIAAGLNVNVTLIFSLKRYQEVIDAYLSGLKDRLQKGLPINNIASVASFFISRVDTKIDPMLEKIVENDKVNSNKAAALLGKAAVNNAKMAYEIFKKDFTSERFERLSASGAKIQRPLWASTSTKNPAYSDVLYVNELIGTDTVNTVPPKTLVAFIDHGKAALTIDKKLEEAKKELSELTELGISMEAVTQELEDEGVKSFADAFKSLLDTVEERAKKAKIELGNLQPAILKEIEELKNHNAVKRMFDIDPTLWTEDLAGQAEIKNRCNWLNAPWNKTVIDDEFNDLRKHCKSEGITSVLLLGMGGSSLAPEVMSLIFGSAVHNGITGLNLAVLDSTDADQVKDALERSRVEETLYVVSSKSGGTAEVNAFLDFFWNQVEEKLGKKTGKHFIAITDPGTNLEVTAKEKGFWKVFYGDPMVGGRYSALTNFGLIPALLLGINVSDFLQNARQVAEKCLPEVPIEANPGAILGAILGTAWKEKKDKLTIVSDPKWESFGTWLEQLIAESSGKKGKGIIPIANEPLLEISNYGKDRLFVYFKVDGCNESYVNNLRTAGFPVIEYSIKNSYDLGGQFYLWEFATALACSILRVNAFDQPDVQDNKSRTLEKVTNFIKTGKLIEGDPNTRISGATIFGAESLKNFKTRTIKKLIFEFIENSIKSDDYVAINAYLPRNAENIENLSKLRKEIAEKFGVATTLGFGPRFLHSTGQLHKGGSNNGIFLQISADPVSQIVIPNEKMSFNTLERAQTLGDFEALQDRGRRLIRIHLDKPDSDILLQ